MRLPPALLARRHGNLLPVRDPLVGALTREPEHRALGLHGLDRAHPELDRLLHHPVHLVARGQRLHQHHLQGRLAFGVATRPKARRNPAPFDHEGGVRLSAQAIEQHHRLTVAQAQHAHRVVREGLGKLELARVGQATGEVEA